MDPGDAPISTTAHSVAFRPSLWLRGRGHSSNAMSAETCTASRALRDLATGVRGGGTRGSGHTCPLPARKVPLSGPTTADWCGPGSAGGCECVVRRCMHALGEWMGVWEVLLEGVCRDGLCPSAFPTTSSATFRPDLYRVLTQAAPRCQPQPERVLVVHLGGMALSVRSVPA
jgi:hypothetical protein